MRSVSANYLDKVRSNGRVMSVTIGVGDGDKRVTIAEIIELNISRAFCDGLQIGACMAARLEFSLRASERFAKGTRLSVWYTVHENGADDWAWISLGRFYVEEAVTERGITTVTAYDAMRKSSLDKVVKWTGTGAPTFPCTQQAALDYVCSRKKLKCDFVCEDFTIQAKLEGFTAREIIGYIAACHGGNAFFDADENLVIKPFTRVDFLIDKGRCYSAEVSRDDGYTVNGILFGLNENDSVYIDAQAGDYNEDAAGIIEVFCPIVDVNIANYAWNKIGGLSYRSIDIEFPGENILELGDCFSFVDGSETVECAVVEQGFSFSAKAGFSETISCEAEGKAQRQDTSKQVDRAAAAGGGGVGKASDWDKTSEYFNDYENNIAGNKDDTKGTALYATAMGQRTTASGSASVAMGSSSVASGAQSVAMGYGSRATGSFSFAMGYQCTASYHSSLAAGWFAQALSASSAAFGSNTKATGQKSIAFGGDSSASGTASVAGGDYGSKASGDSSIAIGNYAEATANYAVAIGQNAKANYISSAAVGAGTQTVENFQFIVGAGNDPASSKNCAFVVGGGKFGAKNNAFSVDWDGNAWCANNLKCRSVECKSITFEGENAANTTARIVFIDHAPTKADVNGAKRVIVQYDPSEPVKDPDTGGYILGSGTALFKVVGVFVEK